MIIFRNATNTNTTLSGTNATAEAAISSNLSQSTATDEPTNTTTTASNNQTDQSNNTSSSLQPTPATIPSGTNQSEPGAITNQNQQQQQQVENPLRNIPIIGEIFGGK